MSDAPGRLGNASFTLIANAGRFEPVIPANGVVAFQRSDPRRSIRGFLETGVRTPTEYQPVPLAGETVCEGIE